MNNLRAIISDRDRPLMVTIIAAITAIFAAYRLLRVIVFLAQYPRLFSFFYFLGPILGLTLSYFLLSGKNWARLVFAFLSSLSALMLTIAMLNEHFTTYGVVAIAYVLFVFGTLTLNQKIVAYFRKQKGVQQAGPGYPPQGVGSPDP
jgi:hypothetical protein